MPSIASTSRTGLTSPETAAAPFTQPAPRNRRIAAFEHMVRTAGVPCEIELPSGACIRAGADPPAFRVKVRSEKALRRLDEYALGMAYVEGQIDFEGDMLALLDVRAALRDASRSR